MIECYLDNCPHHAAKHVPEEYQDGPFCNLERCAWDEPTMTKYLEAVRTGAPHPERHLPLETKDE
jgi:hypothetical protein